MDRVGDQFLAGPGFPQNEYSRLAGGYGRHLVEHLLERRTVSNDLRKLPFGSGFALKVSPFLAKPLLESLDFSRGTVIFDGYRQLSCNLIN